MSETEPTREPRQRTLRQVVGRLAAAIDRELSPGAVAALRRVAPGELGGAAFWQVLASYLEDDLPAGGDARTNAERRWAAVLCGMATTAGLNAIGHDSGRALAQAGLSDHRFDRLLRASGARLHDEARTAARLLASRGEPIDWTDLARVILTDDSDSAEEARRTLARSYYRVLHQLENN